MPELRKYRSLIFLGGRFSGFLYGFFLVLYGSGLLSSIGCLISYTQLIGYINEHEYRTLG